MVQKLSYINPSFLRSSGLEASYNKTLSKALEHLSSALKAQPITTEKPDAKTAKLFPTTGQIISIAQELHEKGRLESLSNYAGLMDCLHSIKKSRLSRSLVKLLDTQSHQPNLATASNKTTAENNYTAQGSFSSNTASYFQHHAKLLEDAKTALTIGADLPPDILASLDLTKLNMITKP